MPASELAGLRASLPGGTTSSSWRPTRLSSVVRNIVAAVRVHQRIVPFASTLRIAFGSASSRARKRASLARTALGLVEGPGRVGQARDRLLALDGPCRQRAQELEQLDVVLEEQRPTRQDGAERGDRSAFGDEVDGHERPALRLSRSVPRRERRIGGGRSRRRPWRGPRRRA